MSAAEQTSEQPKPEAASAPTAAAVRRSLTESNWTISETDQIDSRVGSSDKNNEGGRTRLRSA